MKELSDIKERISHFILSELSLDTSINEIEGDVLLLEKGIIDSMGILRLLAYIEENYGLLLSTEELNSHNFSTIQDISSLVARKLSNE